MSARECWSPTGVLEVSRPTRTVRIPLGFSQPDVGGLLFSAPALRTGEPGVGGVSRFAAELSLLVTVATRGLGPPVPVSAPPCSLHVASSLRPFSKMSVRETSEGSPGWLSRDLLVICVCSGSKAGAGCICCAVVRPRLCRPRRTVHHCLLIPDAENSFPVPPGRRRDTRPVFPCSPL